MPDPTGDALTRLEALIKATWPDVTVQYRASLASWFMWRDMVDAGELTLPFAVLDVLPEEEAESPSPIYRAVLVPFAVYYVRSTALAPGETGHAEDYVAPKLTALARAVFNDFQNFQCIDKPLCDTGAANPANAYLVDKSERAFWAGMVSGRLLVGETVRS